MTFQFSTYSCYLFDYCLQHHLQNLSGKQDFSGSLSFAPHAGNCLGSVSHIAREAASPLSFVSGVQRRFSRVSPSTENIFIKIVKNYLIYPAVAENSPCSPWIFSNVEALTASTVEPAWKFHAGDLNCHEKRKREMCPVESLLWDISSNSCFTFINMCFLLYII